MVRRYVPALSEVVEKSGGNSKEHAVISLKIGSASTLVAGCDVSE